MHNSTCAPARIQSPAPTFPATLQRAVADLADKCQWLGSALRGGNRHEQDAAIKAKAKAEANLLAVLAEALQ